MSAKWIAHKFMLNSLKIGLMLSFFLFTALCVSYAHSEPSNHPPANKVITYKTPRAFWVPECQLRVENTDQGIRYQALRQSSTTFIGPWPEDEGEVELYASTKSSTGKETDEYLMIQFRREGDEVVPKSYIYRDFRQSRNAPMKPAKVCVIKP